MKNKKAELNPIAIVVIIVFLGLIVFFAIKYATSEDETELNVTKINGSISSTATKYVNPSTGAVNITGGKDLTVKSIDDINYTLDPTNKSQVLVRVVYPNSSMTPGDIMSSNVTEICVSGYSDSVRSVSDSLRTQVYEQYKLSPDQPEGTFEVDHLIPLSIGGSNDIKNLWPQPRDPRPGYKEKDVLENYYHRQVCAGKMDLREAQAMMAQNWFQGYVNARAEGGIK